jgi:hypothetical protein
MFSRWRVTNITSARETLYCSKTRIPCGDQFVICVQYIIFSLPKQTHSVSIHLKLGIVVEQCCYSLSDIYSRRYILYHSPSEFSAANYGTGSL